MFGLGRKKKENRDDQLSPRLKALAEVRAHLAIAASCLSTELEALGIDCLHLRGSHGTVRGHFAKSMRAATTYRDGSTTMDLRLGVTQDHAEYHLRPHHRYLELCALVEDLETLRDVDPVRHRDLVTRHAPHGLIQSQLLSFFLLRTPVVEDLLSADDMAQIGQELEHSALSMAHLTSGLTAPLLRGCNLSAMREEWVGWPYIYAEPL